MTVTAPPRPPRRSEPLEREEVEALVEALIEEARQRARRRRRRNGAIVTLVALVGVALFAVVGRSAQSQTASPALSARSSLPAGTANSKIAFTSEVRSGQFSGGLYIVNSDGSGKRRLTSTAWHQTPAWSPDGQALAFQSSYGDSYVYVINADGSGERKLTQTDSGTPSWSPDGRKIAFAGQPDEHRYVFDLYTANADGREQQRLTRNAALGPGGEAPLWSPDGRKIAFVSRREGIATPFPYGFSFTSRSRWPDPAASKGNSEVYVVNADGSGERRLTHNPAYDGDLAWSPDGRKIAFVSNWQVYAMNADGSGKRRLTRSAGHDVSPAWSPDGQTIAFERRLGRRSTGACRRCARASIFEVYVMNANGSGQRRLSRERTKRFSGVSHGVEPLWSPDGRKIAFRSARDGNWEIYVMNADGGGQRNLTRNPAEDDCCFAWSRAQ